MLPCVLHREVPLSAEGGGVMDSPYLKAFEVLRELKAWPVAREQSAHTRLTRDGIDPEVAYRAALALRGKYNPRKHLDLPATLCYWSIVEGRSGRPGNNS